MNYTVYKISRAIVRCVFTVFSPVKATGMENIPEGPAILAINHKSLTDPIKVACVVKRPIAFMAKKELFNVWGLKSLLKALGAFPVDRTGNDFSSVKLAISLVQQGKLFGIFPQGKREFKGGNGFKTGVSLIAARTEAPVVPVYIDARTRLFRKTNVVFGKSVDFGDILKRPTSAALTEATGIIENAILKLGEKRES